ncbi:MAG: diacylglycerol kinase family lipid kinase [Alphaproteobacteria bacterium]|nr:diacylglycerol kinase family lipid kinase [Alphaproteobacteria bacterium]
MRVTAVINRSGGTVVGGEAALPERLAAAFAEAGVQANIIFAAPDDLQAAFEEAAEDEGLDALIAGGGDGTVSLAAAVAVRAGLTLGLVPLGTLNHLARDAGIPADLEAAVAVIAAGHAEAIDVGEVNGRIFVNNSSVGLYPLMVRQREALRKRLGHSKRLAMLVASVRALRHFSRHRLTIRVAGREQPVETPLLFVGNNLYQTSLLALGQRSCLQDGALCLYAVLARSRLQLIGLALRGLIGTLDQQRDFISITGVRGAEIQSRRAALSVSADGETLHLQPPLHYRVLPSALRLLMPQPVPAAPVEGDRWLLIVYPQSGLTI